MEMNPESNPRPESAPPTTFLAVSSNLAERLKSFNDLNLDPNKFGDRSRMFHEGQALIKELLSGQHTMDFQSQLNDLQEDVKLLTEERDAAIETATARRQRVESVQEQLSESQRQLSQSHAQITQLAAMVSQQGDRTGAAPQGETAAAGRDRPSPKHPDPFMFSGTNRKDLRPFIAQLRLKLVQNEDHFTTPQARMRYAVSRLEGVALAQILPHVTETGVNLDNVEAMITILTTAFGDPDVAATAERELNKLQQKQREFSAYYAEFQRLITDLDYNDSAKRNALRRGISDELKDALMYRDIPDSLPDFISLCQKLDNQIRARNAEKKGNPIPKSNPRIENPKPSNVHPTDNGSKYLGPAAMNLDASKKKLSPEEKARRLAEGLCVYCGGENHFASECPVKKRVERSYRLRAAVAEMEAAVINEDSEDSDSGKGRASV